MKKLLLTTIAVLALGVASASAQSLEGAYVGVNGGFATGNLDISNGSTVVDGFNKGVVGEGFVGYGSTFDGIYLGIEGSVGLANVERSVDVAGTGYNVTRKESVGIAARLGYVPTKGSMFYVNGGVNWTNWEVDSGAVKNAEWISSYKLGAGVEQDLTENVFTRLSYDFDIAREDTNKIGGTNVNPLTQTAKLGVGFRF